MTYLLFPGRHLLHTAFQEKYLDHILQTPPDKLEYWQNSPAAEVEAIDQIIFAVTSANQAHSRYNPIPFHVRAIGVDRFAHTLRSRRDVGHRIVGIPHYRPTSRFAAHTLKEIAEQSEGAVQLAPTNCVVLCSTPAVIRLYQELGFAILPAELAADGSYRAATPIEILRAVVRAGETWSTNSIVQELLSPATRSLWADFPEVPRRIFRLWRDPLLNESGSLTDQRDYSTYTSGMSNHEILEIKYADISAAILPGKIVDEGCADGALLARIAKDFPDSDLIGIEITGEFMARAKERQRAGQFGGTFVHFHQRNILQPIFQPASIDTTICNSTVHEIWSYGAGAGSVQDYFALKYRQTRPGGRLVIRDVVGPPEKEQEVLLWLATADGSNQDIFRSCSSTSELAQHLASLSTYARFRRFVHDFRAAESAGGETPTGTISFREETLGDKRYVALTLRAAVEFMTKKDYLDNWQSEMHEEFAFWDFGEWKAAATAAGFRVIENPNTPGYGSRTYTNPWIVEQRWRNRLGLFRAGADGLEPLPYPPTNIVLIAEKPDTVGSIEGSSTRED